MPDNGLSALRQQYHFQPDSDGQKAWDVFRLIELARDLPIEDVELDTITEIDTVYWFDSDYHRPTVRAVILHVGLINSVDLSHPIILGADGRVMDGMHRVAKAVMEGRAAIEARRFALDPDPDYRNCHPSELPYDR